MAAAELHRLGRSVFVMAMMSVVAASKAGPIGTGFDAPDAAPNPACGEIGAKAMPDLRHLHLRTDPRLRSRGRVVKGLYYAARPDGPNELVAFSLACDGRMDSRPFLLFEFDTGAYLLDADGDGCADGVGVLPRGAIDPVEFLPELTTAQRSCASPTDWTAR